MHRYFAIVWDPLNLESTRAFQALKFTAASKPQGWSVACEGPGTLVMHTGLRRGSAEAYPLAGSSGVVLGRVFKRSHGDYATAPRIVFDASETSQMVSSAGQHLVDSYWGAYTAIVYDGASRKHHVFRDPIGNIPCYHTSLKGIDIFFSHIEDCASLLPISFAVNRRHLTRWLVHSMLTTQDTGLENVESVPAGQRMTLSQGHMTRSIMWDAIAIARNSRFERPDEAASTLRSTVQNTIDAWASCYESITHRLSGGLDSSIVAGCLAQAPSKPQINYLHAWIDMELYQERMHMPGIDQRAAEKFRAIAGHGDQRYFARMVAERWQTALIERQKTLAIDLTRLWHVSPRVSPAMYYTVMQTDDTEVELVKTRGTQAFFSGQAGDSVFLATQLPLPAMDYAYLHGISGGLWKQLAATTTLSKESLWAVLAKATRHGLLRRPYVFPIAVLDQRTLLKDETLRTLTNEDFESDLAKRLAQSQLPPGKSNHVKGVGWSAYYEFVFGGGQHADHIDPLNSQPIWELVLQIPTWTMLTGGISRGLARQAFADLLPAEIRKRQVKGTGGPYYQHLVRRNKDFLRATLLDGLLVQQGYLDRRKVEQCLSAPEPSMMASPVFIMNYLAAEIWLQQWSGQQQHGAANRDTTLQNATS